MKHIQAGRRKFIHSGMFGFLAAIVTGLPKISLAQSTSKTHKGIVVRANEGIHILTGRRQVPVTIKLSKAKHGIEGISFCVEDQSAGRKMRIHKHLYHDELIFIRKGEGVLTLGEETTEVKDGDVVFIPRDTWHGLDNAGQEDLQMVFQYSPAGFEEYFIENGTLAGSVAKERTPEDYAAAEKKYGMRYKDREIK